MARTFDGVDDQIFVLPPTGVVGYGTFAIIFRCSSFASLRTLIRAYDTLANNKLGIYINTSGILLFSNGAANVAGSTALSVDTWYCVAAGKATGTTTPRIHIYQYSNNTFTHEDAAGTLADAIVGNGGVVMGSLVAGQFLPGDIEIAAYFTRNLTDTEFEQLPFTMNNWLSLSPNGLWPLDQSAVSQTVIDISGNGANQGNIVGTAVSTNSVPIFNRGGSTWLVIKQKITRSIAGDIPAQSATLARLLQASRSIAGNIPSQTGTLTRLLLALRSVSGNMPTSSGTLSRVGQYIRSVVGNMPTSTATLARIVSTVRTISGDLPASSGSLTRVLGAIRSISGDIPQSTATLIRQALLQRTVTGDFPRPIGILNVVAQLIRSVTGNLPSQTGILTNGKAIFRTLLGDMPNATSTLIYRVAVAFRTLTGNLPNATATLSRIGIFSKTVSGVFGTITGSLLSTLSNNNLRGTTKAIMTRINLIVGKARRIKTVGSIEKYQSTVGKIDND